jgi:hypothetical protein
MESIKPWKLGMMKRLPTARNRIRVKKMAMEIKDISIFDFT